MCPVLRETPEALPEWTNNLSPLPFTTHTSKNGHSCTHSEWRTGVAWPLGAPVGGRLGGA